MKQTVRKTATILTAMVLLVACTGVELGRPATDSRPLSPSRKQSGLCQPFPDRLIDEFLAAYNGRDLEGLQNLVTAPGVEDVVAATYDGDSSFEDVAEWAEVGWDENDRMKLVGYSVNPPKRGFQMIITRRSNALQAHGVEAVSTTLDAISRGCAIESLKMSGMVQAKGQPCAFYAEFAMIDDVAADEPRVCRDGSGDHARTGHAAVWAGHRALLWGGTHGGQFTYGDIAMDGLTFDPGLDRWSRVPAPPLPPFTPEVSAWTGTDLMVLGSKTRPNYRVVGAAYDPNRGSWATLEFPHPGWNGFDGVWTGHELVLWGGPDHSRRPHRRGVVYDPASQTWRRTSPAPIGGRWSHAVVWTGTEMVVWGGTDANSDLANGAAYNPVTDSWREIAPAPISPREWFPMTWTGTEVVVWGGSSYSSNRRDGAAYDPVADTWRMLAMAPIRGRHYHSATWTGTELVIFGGYNYGRTFRDGAAYNPATDSWRHIPRAPVATRCCHSALWTGEELFMFGGSPDLGHMALGDGALYDPGSNRWRRVLPDVDLD